jgi:AcrR family transcriptional regulator
MSTLTKKAIKSAFLSLLNEKPINKITVKEIVQLCGINRNSFYYHYSDIPALLEEILVEQADALLQNRNLSLSIYDYLMSAINFIVENKVAVFHIYNSANRQLFEEYLERISQKATSDYIDTVSAEYNLNTEDKEAIILYYKCQLVGFTIDWLGSGMKYDLNSKLKRICELFEGSTETAFKRSVQESNPDKQ